MATRFTELVGCEHPIQLAALAGGVGGPDLAAAVRDAGGLGMVTAGEMIPSGCGINFLVPFIESPGSVAEACRYCRIIEFFYAWPDATLVACAHDGGALAGWQVGSGEEAVAAQAAGCDFVVAQGTEAGGHVRGNLPLDDVLADVLRHVSVPVVAAGGIGTSQRVREVLAHGADAARIGTCFLACPEAQSHPDYVANLLAASREDTVLTEWFDDDSEWPNAPHRVLSSALKAAQLSGRRSSKPPSREDGQPTADMAQYAGTGVGTLTSIRSAETVVRYLMGEG
jgi:NAD(P)H-dependent flavin oxidoreductase YrpB (nitropropane dioxygenase family)